MTSAVLALCTKSTIIHVRRKNEQMKREAIMELWQGKHECIKRRTVP